MRQRNVTAFCGDLLEHINREVRILYQEDHCMSPKQSGIDPSPKWRPKFQIRYNKLKLKTNTSTRKSTLTLATLPSFSISGVISAEEMYVEN